MYVYSCWVGEAFFGCQKNTDFVGYIGHQFIGHTRGNLQFMDPKVHRQSLVDFEPWIFAIGFDDLGAGGAIGEMQTRQTEFSLFLFQRAQGD